MNETKQDRLNYLLRSDGIETGQYSVNNIEGISVRHFADATLAHELADLLHGKHGKSFSVEITNSHTPGPWQLDQDAGEKAISIVGTVSGLPQLVAIAYGEVAKNDFAPFIANAHLIASAPDLLDLLNEGSSDEDWTAEEAADWKWRSREVIAKARGQVAL